MQRTSSIHTPLLLVLLAGCGELEAPDAASLQSPDEPAEFAPPPQLSQAELAALLAEQTVAALPVAGAGRIDIVAVATSGAPEYTYIAVGGRATTEVLRELVVDQEATAAEVFVALADADLPVPEVLLADHRARAGDDAPRSLVYVAPRTFELDSLDCYGTSGNPQSFSSWVLDWADRFEFINFKQPYKYTARNTSDDGGSYFIPADGFGRVMSACNAGDNDIGVVFWALTSIPGPTYPYTFAGGSGLDAFEAAHLFSTGGSFPYVMSVNHTHPDPDTYVAYGRCGGSAC